MRVYNLRKRTSKINNPFLFEKEGAFTLVELMVTISLIIIFVATAVSYNRSIGQQISLFKDQGSLVNAIYQARSLAITTFSRSAQSTDVPCGYGIHIESSDTIVIFEDLPGSDNNCKNYSTGDPIYTNSEEEVETVHLSGETSLGYKNSITGIVNKITLANNNPVDILFVPPDPQVFSNKVFPIYLDIASSQVGSSFTIKINTFGQISIQ